MENCFPGLSLPRISLGDFPTPLVPLEGLGPGGGPLWCKDEGSAGAAYGGNKVRKLEWLLAEAEAGDAVITVGAAGSNHVVATAVTCRARSLSLEAVLIPQPATEHVRRNLAITHALAHRVWPAASDAGAAWAAGRAWRAARAEGRRVHLVWVGGSTPLGSVGWVAGGLEIGAQVAAGEAPPPTDLFVAAGSCGTAAGLLVGLDAAGLDCRVHAVSVSPGVWGSRLLTLGLARRTAALIRRHGGDAPAPDPAKLAVDGSALGPGYGHATDEAREAVALGAARGLYLETTYTGKALAACRRAIDEGRVGPNVMFLRSISSVWPEVEVADALPPDLEALLT